MNTGDTVSVPAVAHLEVDRHHVVVRRACGGVMAICVAVGHDDLVAGGHVGVGEVEVRRLAPATSTTGAGAKFVKG